MRYTERKNFIKPILIGLVLTIADLFFWGISVYLGYDWISYNYNLQEATYLECVSMYAFFRTVCSTLGMILHSKS